MPDNVDRNQSKQNVDKKKFISITNFHSLKKLAKVVVLLMKPLLLQRCSHFCRSSLLKVLNSLKNVQIWFLTQPSSKEFLFMEVTDIAGYEGHNQVRCIFILTCILIC